MWVNRLRWRASALESATDTEARRWVSLRVMPTLIQLLWVRRESIIRLGEHAG